MVLKKTLYRNSILILLFLVLGSNIALYHTTLGAHILPEDPSGVVIGSMIDIAVISPLLFMAWKRNWSLKSMVISIAAGLVLVRLLIPMDYLAPFEVITWFGFAVEGILVLFEVLVIASLVKYLPNIVRSVKLSTIPVVFSFPNAVEQQVKSSSIIKVISSDLLMFYYAFASWRKQPRQGDRLFTIHQKTSFIAFQIMMIHAIVIETIGIHWWLHEKSMILSLILLVLNIYSVIFFIANIQSVRLNPIQTTETGIYLSLGLMKRMEIKWSDIQEVIDNPGQLEQKSPKNTIEFMAVDLEKVQPDVILRLKRPKKATLMMGISKEFDRVSVRVDDPNRFKRTIKDHLNE
ncbi:beta-carotene 15,15'-monooxygenase [Salinibacillus xinjiangensis]|uniref:Beta-carotene 15,15'-monooxygenase n=1 Tax=Salinibacillus xinjiangensis TaxID=1229268 RepID=A0A6G1X4Q8_9BACI|nr:beta-carotene 15,15'-monooxygenase [Salinibacillus xinjiangensis]MRG85909.1 beta-carotene 15,15'-monooxygenase [Salinibacillus xinjiangensis]